MGNTVVWIDIPATDLERAVDFYGKVLGAAPEFQEMGGTRFAVLPHASGVSGCIVVSDDMRPANQGVLVYLSVTGRHDEAEALVEGCGGKVLQPKHAIGPYGNRSVILDSEGNRIALHSD